MDEAQGLCQRLYTALEDEFVALADYNYAEPLPERRKMMQQWADYLDSLRAGRKIIPIKRKA